jgi:hypothetical protein
VYTFAPRPRIAGDIDSTRDPQGRALVGGVVCLASVPGIRTVSGAAAGQDSYLARQVLYHLEQTSVVWSCVTDAVVGSGATSAIRSASCEAASRLLSA